MVIKGVTLIWNVVLAKQMEKNRNFLAHTPIFLKILKSKNGPKTFEITFDFCTEFRVVGVALTYIQLKRPLTPNKTKKPPKNGINWGERGLKV